MQTKTVSAAPTVWRTKRATKEIFSAAYTKRGVGFGAGGIGAIYKVTDAGVASVLVDLGSDAGAFDRPRDFTPEPPTFDDEAYAKAGKTGLGDLDISEDEKTLWTINLANRSLYKIDIAAAETGPGAAGATLIGLTPDPACVNGIARPFGLAVKDGVVYVGGVCSGELSPTSGRQWNAGSICICVYRVGWMDSCAGHSIFFSLSSHLRRCLRCLRSTLQLLVWGCERILGLWRPWYDSLPNRTGGYAFSAASFEGYVAAPQPMLSDIEFDGPDMILGFRDRLADQIGWFDPGLQGTGNSPFGKYDVSPISAGDILRASGDGAGKWVIEGNGSGATFGPGAHVGDSSGPCAAGGTGGTACGEFYDDNFNPSAVTGHEETAIGALAQVQGAGEVVASIFDPFDIFTGGTRQFSRTTGKPTRGYVLLSDDGPSRDGRPFAKANGIGDVELMSDPAPIEIGNRVWKDTSNNGVQDPGEPGVENVTVQLYRPGVGADCVAGNADDARAIARAITNQNGEYYFRTGVGPDTQIDAQGQVNGTLCPLQPNVTYVIRLDNLSDYNLDEPLEGLALTALNARIAPNASGLNDSDASYVGSVAVITHTTGLVYGANDHTLDFGFVPGLSLGNEVWLDTNNNNKVDAVEVGVSAVTTTLYADTNGNQVIDGLEITPVATDTTTARGFYLFAGLKPGNYAVCLPQANFVVGGPLRGYVSTGVAMGANGVLSETPAASPGGNVDNDDNGVQQTAGFCANGVASGFINLTGNEPTNEVPGNATATQPGSTPDKADPAPNNNSNLTLDFGFYRTKLGNEVWIDTNDNGLRDAIEAPTPGVAVRLYAADGTTEILVGPDGILGTADDAAGGVVTNASGNFEFCVPQGSYIVRVTPPVGFSSSLGVTGQYEPAPDPSNNIDDDDNGTLVTVGAFVGTIESKPIVLTAGSMPGVANAIDNATGQTRNPTIDFGLVRPVDPNAFSLGNRVWLDTGAGANTNNGSMDVGEIGLPGITVTLYLAAGPTVAQSHKDRCAGILSLRWIGRWRLLYRGGVTHGVYGQHRRGQRSASQHQYRHQQ